jgi:FHA domain-containing protein/type VI secretion system protein
MHAHESALIAGMQAALVDTAGRFDPDIVSRKTPPSGTLEQWMPALHKARMWDKQVERYQRKRRELLQEAQAPFGDAFLSGYEAEISRSEEEASGAGHA